MVEQPLSRQQFSSFTVSADPLLAAPSLAHSALFPDRLPASITMLPQTAKPSPFTQCYMTVHLWKHQTYLRTLVQALFIFKIIVMRCGLKKIVL
jgi:hypothetical protein